MVPASCQTVNYSPPLPLLPVRGVRGSGFAATARLIFSGKGVHASVRAARLCTEAAGARERRPNRMNWNVFITGGITGAGDTVDKHPAIPFNPAGVADLPSRRRAPPGAPSGGCRAGPRVRDRRGTRPHRRHGRGPGVRSGEHPFPLEPGGTDVAGPLERLAHVVELRPEPRAGGTLRPAGLVSRAGETLRAMDVRVLGPAEVREQLELRVAG